MRFATIKTECRRAPRHGRGRTARYAATPGRQCDGVGPLWRCCAAVRTRCRTLASGSPARPRSIPTPWFSCRCCRRPRRGSMRRWPSGLWRPPRPMMAATSPSKSSRMSDRERAYDRRRCRLDERGGDNGAETYAGSHPTRWISRARLPPSSAAVVGIVPKATALDHVAGYTLFNDASVREYQFMGGAQWTMGKNFDGTGAFGPWFVTADELPPGLQRPAAANPPERRRGAVRLDRRPGVRHRHAGVLHQPGDHAWCPVT